MFLANTLPSHGRPLDPGDADMLGIAAADTAQRFLDVRENRAETPLHALPDMAKDLGVASIHVKDEGFRLGLGSFKALGGAYAVMRLVLDAASGLLGRPAHPSDLAAAAVRAVASQLTFACATDGNHGRSVAQGAKLVGARAVIFVHEGVSAGRIAAIASFGAEMVRVAGSYDDSVAEASRVAAEKGWTIVSDTSWPGYERIPGLVMQGYTALVRESLKRLPEPPTHVFLQAGVGGFAAAVAGHLAIVLGEARPVVVVVEPARAACLFESARAGEAIRVDQSEPTVMAMLECYEPSRIAWRILSRLADGFITVDEEAAIAMMNRLARPTGGDAAIVAGESGGAGLAGFLAAHGDTSVQKAIGLGPGARILVINTEGATDPALYEQLVGLTPDSVLSGAGAIGRDL